MKPRPQSSGSYREYKHLKDDDMGDVDDDNGKRVAGYDVSGDAPPTLNGGKPFVIWIMGI